MGAPVLRALGLEAGYPGRRVLAGVDLELREGEILAIIGPNGAGKTTLFKTISGELPPLGGSILVETEGGTSLPLPSLGGRERARLMARVLQSEEPAWPLPVESYVEMALFPATGWFGAAGRGGRAAVREALEAMDLLDMARRPVTELSGGEFRRVLIARALAQRSRILLLDEPASDLDLARQMETLGLLRGLAGGGRSVAMIVHDLNHAAMVADRVILIAGGRVLAEGTPREVITAERVSEAYGARVVVGEHPLGDFPQVVHAPGWLGSREGGGGGGS